MKQVTCSSFFFPVIRDATSLGTGRLRIYLLSFEWNRSIFLPPMESFSSETLSKEDLEQKAKEEDENIFSLEDETDEVDLGIPPKKIEEQQQLRMAAGAGEQHRDEEESSSEFEEVDLGTPTVDTTVATTSRTSAGMMMGGGYGGGYGRGMRPPPTWVVTEPMGELPGCPPGLEYLTMVDTIVVQQLIEWVEVMTGYETSNRYILRNTRGEQIYYAFEESDPFSRQCNGNKRTFTMHIVDNFKREVCRIVRPHACCGSNAYVEAPTGVQIGTITQDCGCCGYDFSVRDNTGNALFRVVGPACCPAGEFPIICISGGEIGRITKIFTNLYQEMYTDADTFGVQFPMDLHPTMKAVLLGACFLVDFMYFENTGKNNSNAYGGGGYGYNSGYSTYGAGYGGYGAAGYGGAGYGGAGYGGAVYY